MKTAEQAKQESLKNRVTMLSEVFEQINVAIARGEFSVKVSEKLDEDSKLALDTLGYNVLNHSYYILIRWHM